MRRAVRAFVAACSTMALVGALAVVGAVAESTLPTVRPAAAVADVPAFEFTPLANPCRLVDTRAAGGSLAVGATRSFLAKGSSSLAAQGGSPTGCGVPTTAGAVEIAVTAVSPSGAGFLRLLNADAAKVPDATFVNYTSGVSITNTGTVPIALATSPHFTVANFGGTTQVVVDVLGYFLDSVTAGSYTPLSAPCRAVDTRSGGGPLTTGPAASRSFQIAGTGAGFLAQGGGSSLGCGVPSTATAAVLSITAVAPVGTGFLRIGPNSGSEPAATVVNYTNAVGITNTGAVPRAGTTADITLKNFGTQTDVVVDVLGYYRVGTGTSYRTVVPCRAVDTRFAPGGGVESGTTRLFQVAGPHNAFAAQGTANTAGCGVPDRAAAVAVSVTAVTPSGNGFARLFPAGGTATGTFLNFTSGRSVTNAGALPLANGGVRDLALRDFSARSDFVVDVLGYYEPPPTNPDPAGDLSVGSTHSCRLAALQTVVCWGYGGTGERGTPLYSPGPTPALGVTTAVATASGRDHSCALLADRSIQCWGANDSGQLGNGTTVGSVTPVTVQGITTAVALNASDQHTCALLADRSVRCWGFNERGQLGDGTTTNRSAPVTVTGLSNAAMLTSFREHVCALRTTGTVSCWGANNDGQLGDGTLVDRQAPTAVTGLTGAVAVSAGGGHTCALLSIGTARCWGLNGTGQLGDGTTSRRTTPVPVLGVSGATSIATGGSHSCALLDDGTAKCWGYDSDGQVGDGISTGTRTTPVVVVGLTNAVALDLGLNFSCAILSQGPLSCWGYNADGTIGDGTFVQRNAATPVSGFSGIVAVAGGRSHTCAVVASGEVFCWGTNAEGQLAALGSSLISIGPSVPGVHGAVKVATGSNHTCVLLFDGTVRCWGRGAEGQLGNGLTTQQGSPVKVSGIETAVALTAGSNHTCVLLSSSAVYCWGANANGQLGLGGTSASVTIPEKVSAATGAVDIDGGGLHTCAVLLSRAARCWGANGNGQLGDGTTTQRTAPTAVAGLSTAVGIATGSAHSCAVLADTTMKCWGLNGNGQVGDGTTTQRTSPAAVFESAGVVSISAGSGHTCASTSVGSMACWGRNDNGQLGDGSTTERIFGDAVSGLSAVAGSALGSLHSCAPTFDGDLRCWGDNSSGQLAVGDTTDRLTPTAPGGN